MEIYEYTESQKEEVLAKSRKVLKYCKQQLLPKRKYMHDCFRKEVRIVRFRIRLVAKRERADNRVC